VQQVVQIEDEIDDLEDELRVRHMERLSRNQCPAERGILFLDILSNMERISDHANNLVEYVAGDKF
jgi:phosphate:Na+ symporter